MVDTHSLRLDDAATDDEEGAMVEERVNTSGNWDLLVDDSASVEVVAGVDSTGSKAKNVIKDAGQTDSRSDVGEMLMLHVWPAVIACKELEDSGAFAT